MNMLSTADVTGILPVEKPFPFSAFWWETLHDESDSQR